MIAEFVQGEFDCHILQQKVEIGNQLSRKVCNFFSFILNMALNGRKINESINEIRKKMRQLDSDYELHLLIKPLKLTSTKT